MKRVLTATAGTALIAGVGIGWTWRNILRDLDRIADGPDLDDDTGWAA